MRGVEREGSSHKKLLLLDHVLHAVCGRWLLAFQVCNFICLNIQSLNVSCLSTKEEEKYVVAQGPKCDVRFKNFDVIVICTNMYVQLAITVHLMRSNA